MTVRTHAAALLLGAAWVLTGPATPALALCDAYSGGCPSVPPAQAGGNDIGGNTQNPGSGAGGAQKPGSGVGTGNDLSGTTDGAATDGTANTPATLPFTGGELVLLTALGVGALAGGTALVVAGRRKADAAA